MNLSEEYLYQKYIIEKQKLDDIAKDTGYSTATISRALKKYGLNFKIEKYIGQTFGLLTIESIEGRDKSNHKMAWCQCDCGNRIHIPIYSLITNNTKSCGCNSRKRGAKHELWKGYEEIPSSYIGTCIRGAKERHLVWNITPEIMWKIYIQQNRLCNLTGIPIYFAPTRKKYSLQTASLDRIDSNKGYTKENIQWIHKQVNKMKMELNQDRFIELCERVSEYARKN